MNRRNFLAASATTMALTGANVSTTSAARPVKALSVIIPTTRPTELAELEAAAPGVELVQCRSEDKAIAHAAGASACYGFITPGVIRTAKALKWVQQPSAGVEQLLEIPELVES